MTPNIYFSSWPSPVGVLTLYAHDAAITAITYAQNNAAVLKSFGHANLVEQPSESIRQAIVQLREYFADGRTSFDVCLAPRGTAFQKLVWSELTRIPFGTTVSYQTLANRIASAHACRAVGTANGKNPIAIMIPCHRVIASNGHLAGFSGGLATKAKLIEIERQTMAGFNVATSAASLTL
ncbi:MAG: methylated-DNA--[protein]-cysteine S-methyltransferase [Pseudomonadota bacterium]